MSYRNNNGPSGIETAVAIVTMIAVVVIAGLLAADHVHCWDFFGLDKGCVVTK